MTLGNGLILPDHNRIHALIMNFIAIMELCYVTINLLHYIMQMDQFTNRITLCYENGITLLMELPHDNELYCDDKLY